MKLNPDCIRDLMLFCEENTYICAERVGENVGASYHVLSIGSMCLCPPLNNYDLGELTYHIIQLSESGYIATNFKFDPSTRYLQRDLPKIFYVTPKGHEFIATIESKENWVKTSGILKSAKAVSLSIIETVAKGITEGAINQHIIAP